MSIREVSHSEVTSRLSEELPGSECWSGSDLEACFSPCLRGRPAGVLEQLERAQAAIKPGQAADVRTYLDALSTALTIVASESSSEFQALHRSIELSYLIACDFSQSFDYYRHLINPSDRLAWINAEVELLDEPTASSAKLAKKGRELFYEDQSQHCLHLQTIDQQMRDYEIGGEVLSNLRRLSTMFRQERDEYTQTVEKGNAFRIAKKFSALRVEILFFKESAEVKELLPQKLLPLKDLLQKAHDILDTYSKRHHAVYGSFYDPSEGEVQKLVQESKEVLLQLDACFLELDFHPCVMGQASSVLRDLGVHMTVHDRDSIPSASFFEKLEEIQESCLINKTLNRPQNGLGSVVDRKELETDLLSGASLISLARDGEPFGFFEIYAGRSRAPDEAHRAIALLAQKGEHQHDDWGWAKIVAFSQKSSLTLHRAGVHGYHVVSDGMRQASQLGRCHRLYGLVRKGENANLAEKSHRREGWQGTGVFMSLDEATPESIYEIVRLDLHAGFLD